MKTPKVEPHKVTGTILLMEDEEMVMGVSRLLLERLGYRVLVARTGGEAIRISRTFDGNIDLAILDILSPDMNGKAVYPSRMGTRPNPSPGNPGCRRPSFCSKAILSGDTVGENAGGNRRVSGIKGQPRIFFVDNNFCKYEERNMPPNRKRDQWKI